MIVIKKKSTCILNETIKKKKQQLIKNFGNKNIV